MNPQRFLMRRHAIAVAIGQLSIVPTVWRTSMSERLARQFRRSFCALAVRDMAEVAE